MFDNSKMFNKNMYNGEELNYNFKGKKVLYSFYGVNILSFWSKLLITHYITIIPKFARFKNPSVL